MIITSSPCLPKESYHCGNAISSIITDLIFRYNFFLGNEQRIFSLATPWNLHGLPYERMFAEQFGHYGTYGEIKTFSADYVKMAEKQVSLFLDTTNENYIAHNDIDSCFIEFTVECFIRLIENKFIVQRGGEWFIDTKLLLNEFNIDSAIRSIYCYPDYHKASIIKERNTFDSFYPISKKRIFSPTVCYKGDVISVNPIFQSFIYPLFLAERFHENRVAYQVGGAGYSMLKWQYFKQLISLALTGQTSVENMVLHGTILGYDGKPMSKHSTNTLQPSDLYEMFRDRNFVRYTLIRSISNSNIPIQLDKSTREYNRVKPMLRQIEIDFLKPLKNGTEQLLDQVCVYLRSNKFNLALESYYVYLKKVKLSKYGDIDIQRRIRLLNQIFFVK